MAEQTRESPEHVVSSPLPLVFLHISYCALSRPHSWSPLTLTRVALAPATRNPRFFFSFFLSFLPAHDFIPFHFYFSFFIFLAFYSVFLRCDCSDLYFISSYFIRFFMLFQCYWFFHLSSSFPSHNPHTYTPRSDSCSWWVQD